MSADPHHPTELPPYRAILAVDVRDFSGHKSRFHREITCLVPIVLESALSRCGHADLWGEGFGNHTGDGYVLILDPMYLPYLLNPFLPALQEELTERSRSLPRDYGNLRMRVSISVGPVTGSGEGLLGDGNGDARIEAHRMLDSAPVRKALERSNDVTRVAAIASVRVFEDAVQSGYSAEGVSEYVEVEAEVKSFKGRGYLRVPRLSGDLLRRGLLSEEDRGEKTEANRSDEMQRATSGDASFEFGGGLKATNSTFVHKADGPLNTGSGSQFNAPLGDGVNILGNNQGDVRHRVDKRGSDADH